MKTSVFRLAFGSAVVAFALSFIPLTASAVIVNCNFGDSIQDALDAGQTLIQVRGVCSENVSIQNDSTALLGRTSATGEDKIMGNLIIPGNKKINVSDLTVNGNTFLFEGASAGFDRVKLIGSVSVGTNSHARFSFSELTGDGNVSVVGSSDAVIASSSVVDKTGNIEVNSGSFLNLSFATISNLDGSIFVDVGSSATVFDSTILDLEGGIFIQTGSSATVSRSTIEETDNGIQVFRTATMRFDNSTIGPARIDDGNFSCNPICIGDNSDVRIQNTDVTGLNNDPFIGGAISLFRQASLRLRGSSNVTNNGTQPAISISHNSSFRQDGGSIPVNILGSVVVSGSSYGDVRNANISGDVRVDLDSVFRLRSSSADDLSVVNGNITVSRDSTFDAGFGPPIVNGDVICEDRDSKLSGDLGGFGRRSCRGFGTKKPKKDDDDA